MQLKSVNEVRVTTEVHSLAAQAYQQYGFHLNGFPKMVMQQLLLRLLLPIALNFAGLDQTAKLWPLLVTSK